MYTVAEDSTTIINLATNQPVDLVIETPADAQLICDLLIALDMRDQEIEQLKEKLSSGNRIYQK